MPKRTSQCWGFQRTCPRLYLPEPKTGAQWPQRNRSKNRRNSQKTKQYFFSDQDSSLHERAFFSRKVLVIFENLWHLPHQIFLPFKNTIFVLFVVVSKNLCPITRPTNLPDPICWWAQAQFFLPSNLGGWSKWRKHDWPACLHSGRLGTTWVWRTKRAHSLLPVCRPSSAKRHCRRETSWSFWRCFHNLFRSHHSDPFISLSRLPITTFRATMQSTLKVFSQFETFINDGGGVAPQKGYQERHP